MDVDELMTPEEAASLLKISEHTLAAWRRSNATAYAKASLPWIEVGGLIRYRRRDIQAWLETRTKNGTAP